MAITLAGYKTARTELLFAVPEVTAGEMVYPAGSNAVRLTDDPNFDQMIAIFKSMERKNTLAVTRLKATRYPAGKFDFSCYIKPSGVAGTAPVPGQCLKGLFGRETIVGATSVTYLPLRVSDGLPGTYTIALKIGEMVMYQSGCLFEKGTFSIVPGPVEGDDVGCKFEGEFFKQHIAGVSTLAADQVSGDSTIEVDDASQFLNEPFIEILNATTGAIVVTGKQIVSIDYDTNIITISGTLGSAVSTGMVVHGSLPVATDSGNFAFWHVGTVQEDSEDIFITGAEVTYANGYKVIDNEKNGLLYPNAFMINGLREVLISNAEFYFDATLQAPLWRRAQILGERAWEVPFGDQDFTVGNQATMMLPKVVMLSSPKISSNGGNELTLARSMQALEDTGSDEMSIIFT